MSTKNNITYMVASRDTTKYSIKVITSSKGEAYEVWRREYPKFKKKTKSVNKAILLMKLFDLTDKDIQMLENSKADIKVAAKYDLFIQRLVDEGDCLEYYEPGDLKESMNETVIVYIVHSDINENNIYAEFATEEGAIEYAKRHIDELTYVDRAEALVDDGGDIVEILDSETIWVYADEGEGDTVETEDEYWDRMAKEEADRIDAEACLGDTTWFEDLDTDQLVETLEENEDIVECKECFELFPKADCVKIEVGYLCPHCHGTHCEDKECIEDEPIVLFDVADEDVFKVDFPEAERFSFSAENEMIPDEPTPEVENDPISEPECVGPECEAPIEAPQTKEEVIDTLVKDEEEAIDGYTKAENQIDSISDLEVEEKEEIKSVIDHIREEEVEHIEELEELVDEVEETKADEPAEESESEEKEILHEDDRSLWKKLFDNPDSYWEQKNRNPKEDSKIYPHQGYAVKQATIKDNKLEISTDFNKEVKKYGEAEQVAKAESANNNSFVYIVTPKGEPKTIYLVVYSKGQVLKGTESWLQKALDIKAADKNVIKPEEPKSEEPKNEETSKYKADPITVTVGKAAYIVVKDTELDSTVNINKCEVLPDKDDIVECLKSKKQRWMVKGSKPGKVTLTITLGDKKICTCEVAVKAKKLSKEDQEAIEKAKKLLSDQGYKVEAPVTESLEEHVNEEHSAIESDQVLVGIDNAVVDCKVADVVTHSEDEKPVDCKGENKPLEKPLTESTTKNILDMVKDTVDSRGYDTWIYGGSGYISYCIEIIKDGDEYKANEYISTESGVGDTDPEFIYSSTDFRDVIKFLLDEGYFDTEDSRDSQDISRTDAEGYLRNLTEATHAQVAKPEGSRTLAYNNALTYAKKANKPYIFGYTNHTGKFFALDLPLKVTGNPGEAEKEFRNKYKNSKVVYIAYPDKDFITESKFTKAEQEEYNMDEDGISLDSYDEFVRCGWCGEIFTKDSCVFEKDFGWLCDRCQDELKYHGGHLDIIVDPTEEDIERAENNR